MGDKSISSSDRAENWFERTRFCSAFFSLSEVTGLGGTWGLLEGVEHLGCENPLTSTRTLSTLTLVGEHLEDDESSFEVSVFKGPAEPLGALLEGTAEPLDAFGVFRQISASPEPYITFSKSISELYDTWVFRIPSFCTESSGQHFFSYRHQLLLHVILNEWLLSFTLWHMILFTSYTNLFNNHAEYEEKLTVSHCEFMAAITVSIIRASNNNNR